ncbi:uncharacterized protein C7orf50 homolog isoform X3 [Manis pentadactyla]|uniref:uncharacterized protein C7orf50 homolog isoform X3 n=1 Tax=Manis pentadactyla TaxID=143292 RepID=UPI00255D0E12|nr:uncharacterized protein C7orf50 homolog isoform X3 [Manis pentadactyla]XP_057343460.1 uncharacterized protein C7orf50 homolog isoform X3 [Manis pentadactyla]
MHLVLRPRAPSAGAREEHPPQAAVTPGCWGQQLHLVFPTGPLRNSGMWGWAGDGPCTVPRAEEGPGKEAEEGAQEGGKEAAAGGRHHPRPQAANPALRGPAGPGLPPWVPDEHFSTLLAYLEGLKGRARELTVQKAEALMQQLDGVGDSTDPLLLEKSQRVRHMIFSQAARVPASLYLGSEPSEKHTGKLQ